MIPTLPLTPPAQPNPHSTYALPIPLQYRRSGSTPSSGTGPSSSLSSTVQYYYFAETSGSLPAGTKYALNYDATSESQCSGEVVRISFFYSMYGAGIGALRVTDTTGVVLWSKSGNQNTPDWKAAIDVVIGEVGFVFEYTRGSSYLGDAAVAKVDVTCIGDAGAGATPGGSGGSAGGDGQSFAYDFASESADWTTGALGTYPMTRRSGGESADIQVPSIGAEPVCVWSRHLVYCMCAALGMYCASRCLHVVLLGSDPRIQSTRPPDNRL